MPHRANELLRQLDKVDLAAFGHTVENGDAFIERCCKDALKLLQPAHKVHERLLARLAHCMLARLVWAGPRENRTRGNA